MCFFWGLNHIHIEVEKLDRNVENITFGAVSCTKMWWVFVFFDVIFVCLFGKHHLKY